jgi:hypothetical protein
VARPAVASPTRCAASPSCGPGPFPACRSTSSAASARTWSRTTSRAQGLSLDARPWVDAGLVEIVEGEIRFKFNGSRIYLCHCHEEKDRFKYQGAEIHVLLIDELTHFTEVIYRFLRSRVRMVGMNLPEA